MVATRSKIGAAVLLIASASAVAVWLWRVRTVEPAAARQARSAVASGRYNLASAALERWRAVAPDDPGMHLVEGRILIARGAVVESGEALSKAVAAGIPVSEADVLRALIAVKIKRGAEALPTLQHAFDQAQTPDRQVDEALALAYLEAFDLGNASVVLDRWARDFPGDPKPYLWKAEIHARDGGDPGSVLYDYQDALRRDSNLFAARLGLADTLRQLHRAEEAAVAYEACLAAEPDNASAQFGAGCNLLILGDEPAAIPHLIRAAELDPNNAEPLKELAESAVRRRDWAEALTFLDRATALDPNDSHMRYRRGIVLGKLDRPEDARKELAEADRLRADVLRLNQARSRLVGSPHDYDCQITVARWWFEHGRPDEGARWAQHVLADRPADPEASRLLADYHEQRGETGLANFHRLHATSEKKR